LCASRNRRLAEFRIPHLKTLAASVPNRAASFVPRRPCCAARLRMPWPPPLLTTWSSASSPLELRVDNHLEPPVAGNCLPQSCCPCSSLHPLAPRFSEHHNQVESEPNVNAFSVVEEEGGDGGTKVCVDPAARVVAVKSAGAG
jgi:hypothetical protein